MKRMALRQANESEFLRARVGAALVKGNRLLSVGKNSVRGYRHDYPKKWSNSLHAEQDAILSAIHTSGIGSVRGATLFVSRIGIKGERRNACPCSICRSMIIEVGIKKVVYTNEHGDWVTWRL
jgi:deoxycytidylate deaminase